LSERCIVGFSSAADPVNAYNNNLQIATATVVLHTEMIHEARVVPLNGRPHLPESMRPGSATTRPLGGRHVRRRDHQLHRQVIVQRQHHRARRVDGGDAPRREVHARGDDTLLYEFTVTDPPPDEAVTSSSR
jgi:hypothetical protein